MNERALAVLRTVQTRMVCTIEGIEAGRLNAAVTAQLVASIMRDLVQVLADLAVTR